MTDRSDSLWSCPKCGAKLLSRGVWHACGKYSVEQFLAGKGERARLLFDRFAALVAACGPYQLAPAKTRIAFMVLVRFASVNRAGEFGLDVHFVLPTALRSNRCRRVERVKNCYVHHLRLTRETDLDHELQEWLRRSYSEYGQRRWLKRRKPQLRRAKGR